MTYLAKCERCGRLVAIPDDVAKATIETYKIDLDEGAIEKDEPIVVDNCGALYIDHSPLSPPAYKACRGDLEILGIVQPVNPIAVRSL